MSTDARTQIMELAERVKGRGLRCTDFQEHPDFPGCCYSCHDDHDDFGYDLCEARVSTSKGEVEASVCCKVKLWLDSL